MNLRGPLVGLSFLLAVMMLVTCIPMKAEAASPTYVFFTEDVEEPTFQAWHVRWHKTDENPASSLDYWCRQGHEFHSGTHAAYCARSGYNSHYVTSDVKQPMDVNITGLTGSFNKADQVLRYDTNEDAVMRKELIGARFYENITMTFWFYSDTGASDAKQPLTGEPVGYDFLNVLYYTGTNNSMVKHVLWTDTEEQASAKTWAMVALQVPNNATHVAFEFVSGTTPPQGGDPSNAFTAYGIRTTPSGSSGMKEGVFVDDISVVGTDPAENVPLTTQANPLAAYQTNRTFSVGYSDNNPLVQLDWIYLWYRQMGEENWTKYKTEAKPSGAFISSPIKFTAPNDGAFEFFTQGVDTNGTLEEWKDSADTLTVVDTAAPTTTASFAGTMDGSSYVGSAHMTLVANDGAAGVANISYRMDGSEWVEYYDVVNLTATGHHVIDYYAGDMAGHTESVKTQTVDIIGGLAGVTIADANKVFKDGNVTISFTASAWSIAKLEYSLNDGAYVQMDPNSTAIAFNGLADGQYDLKVRATDPLNNVMMGETNFTVDTAPVTPSFIDAGGLDPLVLIGLGAVAFAGIALVALVLIRRRK